MSCSCSNVHIPSITVKHYTLHPRLSNFFLTTFPAVISSLTPQTICGSFLSLPFSLKSTNIFTFIIYLLLFLLLEILVDARGCSFTRKKPIFRGFLPLDRLWRLFSHSCSIYIIFFLKIFFLKNNLHTSTTTVVKGFLNPQTP